MVETRPSNAHRWLACSAAPLFASHAGPQPESDPAREGTCAAWVAEMVLTGRAPDANSLTGQAHPNGWEVDDEMASHCQDYIDLIRATPGQHFTEQHVTLSDLIAGTLDSATFTPDGTLIVRDLKYGRRLIEPDTPQLVIYAGAMLSVVGPVQRVRTEIYQPRGFHPRGIHRVRDWTPEEIWTLCQHYDTRAQACYAPDPVATPGPQCVDCDGATRCAALSATVANIVALVEMPHDRQRTPAEMASNLQFLRWAERIVKAATSAAETESLARHMAGDTLPGWGMSERLGQTKVTVGPDAIRAMTGKDPLDGKDIKLTVADLKRAGLSERQIRTFTDRPVIGYKLEPLDASVLVERFTGPPALDRPDNNGQQSTINNQPAIPERNHTNE